MQNKLDYWLELEEQNRVAMQETHTNSSSQTQGSDKERGEPGILIQTEFPNPVKWDWPKISSSVAEWCGEGRGHHGWMMKCNQCCATVFLLHKSGPMLTGALRHDNTTLTAGMNFISIFCVVGCWGWISLLQTILLRCCGYMFLLWWVSFFKDCILCCGNNQMDKVI